MRFWQLFERRGPKMIQSEMALAMLTIVGMIVLLMGMIAPAGMLRIFIFWGFA
jgi:hypothetical protein